MTMLEKGAEIDINILYKIRAQAINGILLESSVQICGAEEGSVESEGVL